MDTRYFVKSVRRTVELKKPKIDELIEPQEEMEIPVKEIPVMKKKTKIKTIGDVE